MFGSQMPDLPSSGGPVHPLGDADRLRVTSTSPFFIIYLSNPHAFFLSNPLERITALHETTRFSSAATVKCESLSMGDASSLLRPTLSVFYIIDLPQSGKETI
mmetsp:Transcript_6679/g.16858  ORF Transcript_6679/g.16858 Transcript_6679/m.16858 type:complete len:103 (-) Transcript_6679:517-825(-)